MKQSRRHSGTRSVRAFCSDLRVLDERPTLKAIASTTESSPIRSGSPRRTLPLSCVCDPDPAAFVADIDVPLREQAQHQVLPTAASATLRRNVVVNGGFEHFNGTRPLHWSTRGAANVFFDRAHSGTAHMDLVVGAPLPNVASVSQAVTIPASTTHAALTFWAEDWSCGANIHFDAHVIAGGHDTIVTTIPGAACGTGYVKTSASLAQFKGQNVTLRFSTTWVSGGGGSLFYLDDVSLRVN
jgi:hypothetical protein